MPYRWIRFLHIATAIGFVGIHGASIVLLYALRKERDRVRIEGILDFSSGTATAMYVSLAAVIGTGVWLGFTRTRLFGEVWYWLSLVLLVAISALMYVIAKPFTARIRQACEIRPTGVPRVSDEELAQIMRSSRTYVVTAIGVGGLLAILYLMVFQPAFGADDGPVTEGPSIATTTTTAGAIEDPVLALGREIFEVTAGGTGCAECHGLDGLGTSDADAVAGASKSAIREALDEERDMADIDLSEEELEAVFQYLQTLP